MPVKLPIKRTVKKYMSGERAGPEPPIESTKKPAATAHTAALLFESSSAIAVSITIIRSGVAGKKSRSGKNAHCVHPKKRVRWKDNRHKEAGKAFE